MIKAVLYTNVLISGIPSDDRPYYSPSVAKRKDQLVQVLDLKAVVEGIAEALGPVKGNPR
jgi:hypothetical protein